jgi:hypothetical protein
MNEAPQPENRFQTLSRAFPGVPDDALEEAEGSIDRYLAIVLRIYDQICADPATHAALIELTAGCRRAEMEGCTSPALHKAEATESIQS